MSLDGELPIWQDGGRWGLEAGAFLPPLKLTLDEATTLFLAARVLAKASDEQDPELIGAFVKLAQVLPDVLAEHIRATADAFATTPANERFTRVFRTLTQAWAGRRVVESSSTTRRPTTRERGPRRTPRASLCPRAIGPDPRPVPDRLRRGTAAPCAPSRSNASWRPRSRPQTFTPDAGFDLAADLRRAWDIMADEPLETVVVRFAPAVAQARRRDALARQPGAQPAGRWFAACGAVASPACARSSLWMLGWGADAEVLEPPALRTEIADELRRAAAAYA